MAHTNMMNYTYGAAPQIPTLDVDDPCFASSLAAIEDILNYNFNDRALVLEALLGERREVMIGEKLVRQGSQRLAVLGDTMLRSAFWDANFTNDELVGETCREHDSIGSNANLAQAGRDYCINELIIGVDGETVWGTDQRRVDVTMVASTMEALIGAVWLDTKDMEAVKGAIRLLLSTDKV